MSPISSRARALAVAVSTLVSLSAASAAAAHPDVATPGAPSVGDRLFPGLGNGGYDVEHYTLDFSYATTASVQSVPAVATIEARATQTLSRFNLDFDGDAVRTVSVDGRPAASCARGRSWSSRRARRCAITAPSPCRSPIRPGRATSRRTRTSTPCWAPPGSRPRRGRSRRPSPTARTASSRPTTTPSTRPPTRSGPRRPPASTFVADGELAGKSTRNGRTKSVYEAREPMASELIQLAFGNHAVQGARRPPRASSCAIWRRPTSSPRSSPRSRASVDHLDYMIDRVGRYPFSVLRHVRLRRDVPVRPGDADDLALPGLLCSCRRSRLRRSTSRSCARAGAPCGSATTSRPLAGAMCGSTRATPPGTSGPTPTSSSA